MKKYLILFSFLFLIQSCALFKDNVTDTNDEILASEQKNQEDKSVQVEVSKGDKLYQLWLKKETSSESFKNCFYKSGPEALVTGALITVGLTATSVLGGCYYALSYYQCYQYRQEDRPILITVENVIHLLKEDISKDLDEKFEKMNALKQELIKTMQENKDLNKNLDIKVSEKTRKIEELTQETLNLLNERMNEIKNMKIITKEEKEESFEKKVTNLKEVEVKNTEKEEKSLEEKRMEETLNNE